jgi:hypothetical protein
MARFIAVYSGPTIGAAELVAVSADPGLVDDVAARLLPDEYRPRATRRQADGGWRSPRLTESVRRPARHARGD